MQHNTQKPAKPSTILIYININTFTFYYQMLSFVVAVSVISIICCFRCCCYYCCRCWCRCYCCCCIVSVAFQLVLLQVFLVFANKKNTFIFNKRIFARFNKYTKTLHIDKEYVTMLRLQTGRNLFVRLSYTSGSNLKKKRTSNTKKAETDSRGGRTNDDEILD